jgi:hypothetical protein
LVYLAKESGIRSQCSASEVNLADCNQQRKERMKLSSSANVLQNSVAQLVLLALTVLATACSGPQKHAYSDYAILPAYHHYDQRQLRQVQISLRRLGYYSGSADGFMGYRTDLAISRFQLDHEHPVRPVVDRWLLVSLGIVRPLID